MTLTPQSLKEQAKRPARRVMTLDPKVGAALAELWEVAKEHYDADRTHVTGRGEVIVRGELVATYGDFNDAMDHFARLREAGKLPSAGSLAAALARLEELGR